jgi:hypothetical protein
VPSYIAAHDLIIANRRGEADPMTYHSDPPPNGYVRISSVVLQALRMQHLVSEIDSSIALPEGTNPRGDVDLTGLTEWVGVWNDTKISVGWDWAVIRGVIIMLNPTEIRTNILVSEENGIDSPFLT